MQSPCFSYWRAALPLMLLSKRVTRTSQENRYPPTPIITGTGSPHTLSILELRWVLRPRLGAVMALFGKDEKMVEQRCNDPYISENHKVSLVQYFVGTQAPSLPSEVFRFPKRYSPLSLDEFTRTSYPYEYLILFQGLNHTRRQSLSNLIALNDVSTEDHEEVHRGYVSTASRHSQSIPRTEVDHTWNEVRRDIRSLI